MTAADPEPQPSAPPRAGRVKTRLLGFHTPEDAPGDPLSRRMASGDQTSEPMDCGTQATAFPVGWIVVEAGPGRGAAYTLHAGVSTIGRGAGQTIRLDHGDTTISRENHAAVAYDDEQARFFMGHGGKANLVRLNGMPVLSTEPLAHGDRIRIGETTLRFVALCGPDFSWQDQEQDGQQDARRNGAQDGARDRDMTQGLRRHAL